MIFISTFHSYTGAHWHFQGEGCGGGEEPLQGDSFLLELFQHQESHKVTTYIIHTKSHTEVLVLDQSNQQFSKK